VVAVCLVVFSVWPYLVCAFSPVSGSFSGFGVVVPPLW